jgi:hypothetical protein
LFRDCFVLYCDVKLAGYCTSHVLEPLVALIQSLIHLPQPSLPLTLRQAPHLYAMLKEAGKLMQSPRDAELLHRLLTRSIGMGDGRRKRVDDFSFRLFFSLFVVS